MSKDYEIKEYKGRKYKVHTLPNGDRAYFVDSIRGKERRHILKLQGAAAQIQEFRAGQSIDDIKIGLSVGEYLIQQLESIPVFCHKITVKNGDGEAVKLEPVTMQYYDDADEETCVALEDALKIAMGELESNKKK